MAAAIDERRDLVVVTLVFILAPAVAHDELEALEVSGRARVP